MPGSELPQELVDIIINELQNDTAALQACSLVCLSWVPTSQRHLFRFISLAPSYHKRGTHAAFLSKFHALLATSPHLSHNVRTLELDPSRTAEIDIEPFFTHLQRLQEIRIVDFEEAPMFPFERRLPFHALLTLPNVTRLKIGPGAWYLGDVLPCLRNGGRLKDIAFQDVIFEGYEACSTLMRLPEIHLESLRIDRGFVGLLGDLHEIPGMDLRRLKRLEVLMGVRNAQTSVRWRNRFPIRTVQDVLKGIEGTLEHLSLDVFLDEPLYNVVDISCLRSLSIHIRWYVSESNPRVWLDWITASLRGIKKPSVMEVVTLRITTYADDVVPDFASEWECLDELLARPVMARLQRVDIVQDSEVAVTSIPTWRCLENRGVAVSHTNSCRE
ncbi:hypothetical protein BDZ89DRAFT_390152 [Hymenopellis radicata]|nr:hypothetical protein BDZ89DRAFT_390152 [Hymenopellis radicata]